MSGSVCLSLDNFLWLGPYSEFHKGKGKGHFPSFFALRHVVHLISYWWNFKLRWFSKTREQRMFREGSIFSSKARIWHRHANKSPGGIFYFPLTASRQRHFTVPFIFSNLFSSLGGKLIEIQLIQKELWRISAEARGVYKILYNRIYLPANLYLFNC